MGDDNGNNKKKIAILEKQDEIFTVQIKYIHDTVKDIHKTLTQFMQPDGTCDTNRRQVATNTDKIKTHGTIFKWLAGLSVPIIGLLIKAAFFG